MKKTFMEAIVQGGLVSDGAMGSLLYERGIFVNRNFDEVNLSQPELVYKIHREYLLAGAEVLESNTYGANRIRLARHGLADKTVEINRAALAILKRAAEDAAYLAGSIGPTGLTPGEVRRNERAIRHAYAEQAVLLTEAGVNALVIETFIHPEELRLAVESARQASPLPIVAHIAATAEGAIVDGTAPEDLAKEMAAWGADVVGVNCNGPEAVYELAVKMLQAGLPVSVMPNAGQPKSVEDRLIYLATPENFGVFARRFFKAGVKMVGGCCGTSPAHIARVSAASRMLSGHLSHALPAEPKSPTTLPEKPVSERSSFGAKLGKRFVVSVEVNPTHPTDPSVAIAAAQKLIKAGADVINIADGPRATARMSNLALAVKMQAALEGEVLLHMCCRDHNLLGLQAQALGAHALGIRNLVIVTGDPPKVGDYPDAMAVYDLDSIGLLRLLTGLNRGIDPSGKALPSPTEFVLATGVEPGAADFPREMMRLREKIAAGAHLVMTQPIYEPTQLDRFLDVTAELNVPILVGVLPLASYRNAEFIHNHIPGMGIPEAIRERLRKTPTGEAARREGVAIALETLAGVRHRVAGAYIMPPLGQFGMAEEILAALGDRALARKG